MTYRVGVDIGGSFTDFALLDERDNSIRTLKVLSRPDSPGSEITTGLARFSSAMASIRLISTTSPTAPPLA